MGARGVNSIKAGGLRLHQAPSAPDESALPPQRQPSCAVGRVDPSERDPDGVMRCAGAAVDSAIDSWQRSAATVGSHGLPGRSDQAAAPRCGVRRCARIAPLIDGWEIAGAAAGEPWAADELHEWFVHADGQLSLSVGRAYERGVRGSLVIAAVGGALRAQREDGGNPGRVAERINRALWTGSAGDEWSSLFHAEVEPDTGVIDFVTAGAVSLLMARGRQLEIIVQHEPPLGLDPAAVYRMTRRRLVPGEVLVVASGRAGQQFRTPESAQAALADRAEPAAWTRLPAAQIATFWREQSRQWPGGDRHSAAILVAKRTR